MRGPRGTGLHKREIIETFARRLDNHPDFELAESLRNIHRIVEMRVNDKFGHGGGDEVLREVASRIKAELRISDALGRFGGEEFVVLLIDADLESATVVAQRIRASIANIPFELSSGELLPVSVSIGVATLDDFERDHAIEGVAQELIASADAALYQAKAAGRNQVVRFA